MTSMVHLDWLCRQAPLLFALTLLVSAASVLDAQVTRDASHLFETADRCMACHNGLVTPAGEDVSIGFNWRATMMANAARDPY